MLGDYCTSYIGLARVIVVVESDFSPSLLAGCPNRRLFWLDLVEKFVKLPYKAELLCDREFHDAATRDAYQLRGVQATRQLVV